MSTRENIRLITRAPFENPTLKLAVCPLNIHNFKFKWSNDLRQTENKSRKAIMISLIQHFEADFLWKVSLKILI